MNSKVDQIGGDHYQAEYQHWDWAAETQLGYLEGNATKYISRWHKKGGVQDLEKALSYIKKLVGTHNQRALVPAGFRPLRSAAQRANFINCAEVNLRDAQIIGLIDTWQTVDNLVRIAQRIEERIANPDVNHPAPFGWVGEDGGCE